MVLSPRPATIQAGFGITQAHPRKLSSPELLQMKDAILAELGL
jgi:ABC-type nitrate/sulfonate/bicarbonate transport system ATPase subunit